MNHKASSFHNRTLHNQAAAMCPSVCDRTLFRMTAFLAMIFAIHTAQAQSLNVLFTFDGSNGGNPDSGVVRDSSGNFYGTTFYGGTSDNGTVFKLDANGAETVLYSFTGSLDGGNPYAGVIRDGAGNLYGTTTSGGGPQPGCSSGCGVVYKIDPAGQETVLYRFTGEKDGATPTGSLLRDSSGNLYGTTSQGGSGGQLRPRYGI